MIRNKIKYLLILFLAGVVAVLYNEYTMGLIFLTVLVIPALLFAILSYTYGKVRATLLTNMHIAKKGETISIAVNLRNPTIFPISNMDLYFSYCNRYSKKKEKKSFRVSIDRKTSIRTNIQLQSEYVGNLEICFLGYRIYDYIQLFSLKMKKQETVKIAILPELHEITENLISDISRIPIESDYYSSHKSGDDPSEVFAIREYREGDRPQKIHWKLSSKQDQLMIKEFSAPLNCSILIYIDFKIHNKKDFLRAADALLECSLSLSYSFLTKGIIHYLAWYDDSQGVCKRIRVVLEKDFFEAVDGLLQVSSYSEKVESLQDYHAQYPYDQYTDFFYITNEISEKQLDTITLMNIRARQMIYVRDGHEIYEDGTGLADHLLPKDMLDSLNGMGIGILPVGIGRIAEDIEQWRLA